MRDLLFSALVYVLDVLGGASDVLCTCCLVFLLVLEIECRGVKKDSFPYVGQVILTYVPV